MTKKKKIERDRGGKQVQKVKRKKRKRKRRRHEKERALNRVKNIERKQFFFFFFHGYNFLSSRGFRGKKTKGMTG